MNLSGGRADGRVLLHLSNPDGPITFDDLLSGEQYQRDRAQVAAEGLYVALDGAGVHLLRWTP